MPTKYSILVITIAAMLLPSAPAIAQDFDIGREREQKKREVADLPTVHVPTLHDALSIRIEDNNLAIYTQLPTINRMSKIKIQGSPGIYTVQLFADTLRPKKSPVAYRPAMINFVHWVFNNPVGTESSTTVSVTPMSMNIAYDTETATQVSQISLVQSNEGVDPGEPPVRLIIHIGDQPNMVRSARDFVSLRRQYPAETSKYLEPIFRELGAEDIFRPDARLTWQVFAAEAQPDPTINDRIKAILPRLDSDDFHTRESASADLQKLGEAAAICLWKMDRSKLSVEQNSRLDAFLKPYQPVTEEDVARLRNDATFLIECLHEPDDFLFVTALNQLEHIVGHSIPFDRTLHGDQRETAINALRDRIIPPATQPVVPG